MSGGLPEPSRAREELQSGNVRGNTQVSEMCGCIVCVLLVFCGVFFLSFVVSFFPGCVTFCLVVCLSVRTLLALGCHVGMGDEKAEENLKRIKLPKT